jgi:hypothetical protein
MLWLDDPSELYGRWTDVLLLNKNTDNDNINSLTRLFIYGSIVFAILFKCITILIICMILLFLIYISYQVTSKNTSHGTFENYGNPENNDSHMNDILKDINTYIKTKRNKNNGISNENNGNTNNGISNENNGINGISNENNGILNENNGISNENNGISNENNGISNENNGISNENNGIRCAISSIDNPFSNILLTDRTLNPTKTSPCDNQEIDVKKIYRNTMFRDMSDIYNSRNNERAFLTNPSNTIPNDQTGFARNLYDTSINKQCKSGNAMHCLKTDNIRLPGGF